jgi:hypothetical protein
VRVKGGEWIDSSYRNLETGIKITIHSYYSRSQSESPDGNKFISARFVEDLWQINNTYRVDHPSTNSHSQIIPQIVEKSFVQAQGLSRLEIHYLDEVVMYQFENYTISGSVVVNGQGDSLGMSMLEMLNRNGEHAFTSLTGIVFRVDGKDRLYFGVAAK